MKFLIRFLISLTVFVLTGYGQLDAHTHNEGNSDTIVKNLDRVGNVNVDIVSHGTNLMRSSHYFEPDTSKIRATDNEGEEEELSQTSKKSSEISSYFIPSFFNNVPASFYHYVKKSLPFTEHFSHFTSYRRYIAFRVFRI